MLIKRLNPHRIIPVLAGCLMAFGLVGAAPAETADSRADVYQRVQALEALGRKLFFDASLSGLWKNVVRVVPQPRSCLGAA